MKSATLLLALALLAGCPADDSKPEDTNEPVETGEPDGATATIFIQPASLEFGSLAVGRSLTATLTVWNTGRGELQLSTTTIDDSAGPFSVTNPPVYQIPSGESDEMQVSFTPTRAGEATASLLVASNDPATPNLTVPLQGTGLAPSLALSPATEDLGAAWVGCELFSVVQIENEGNTPLVVDSATLDGAVQGFSFALNEEHHGPLPWTLSAGEDRYLGTLSYLPLTAGEAITTLTVSSDDPEAAERQSTFSGSASLFAAGSDAFIIEDRSLDILFAVDRSGSMTDELATIVAGFPNLVASFTAAGADFQVSMVAEDDGCINGPELWLDNTSTGDITATVNAWMNLAAGSTPYTEHAFTLWEAALRSAALAEGGCNEGFIRDEGTLHLVGISDEPEQSPGAWSDHASELQSLKENPSDVVFYGIGGAVTDTCTQYYRGIWEASLASGGSWVSICSLTTDDMTALAEDILAIAADHSSFLLSAVPVAETLTVNVDGAVQSGGWSYDATTNRVLFDSSLSPGATLQIDYAVAADCDTVPH